MPSIVIGLMARYELVADVGPSVVRCPPRGLVSKIEQDSPKVVMEHYQEVYTADSVAEFSSSADIQ